MDQQLLDFEYRVTNVSPSQEESGYADDMAMLRDYFRLLDYKIAVAKKNTAQPSQRSDGEWSRFLTQRIERKLAQTKPRDESCWLMKQFKKMGLGPEERLVVAMLCYHYASNQSQVEMAALLDVVCDGDRIRMISLRPKLKPEAKLMASGLVALKDLDSPFHDGPFLTLGWKVKARLFRQYEVPVSEGETAEPPTPRAVASGRGKQFQSPREIYAELDRYLVGQEQAKRAVALALYQHQQRIWGKSAAPRNNLMLVGPTGCGKTYLAELAAKLAGVPLVICDATQYSEVGYMGSSVEEMMVALYRQAGKDPKAASRGIIFIDEIDKIAAAQEIGHRKMNRDVSGQGVQEDLLRMIEGGDFPNRPFDAKNVLFMAGGAFSGLLKNGGEKRSGAMGFVPGGRPGSAPDRFRPALEDFVAYGMLPELMGRFSQVVFLDPLGRDDLVKILVKDENSPVEQYRSMLAAHGIKLELQPQALETIAERAQGYGTGARALRSILNEVMQPLVFEAIGRDNGDRVLRVTREMVRETLGGNDA